MEILHFSNLLIVITDKLVWLIISSMGPKKSFTISINKAVEQFVKVCEKALN